MPGPGLEGGRSRYWQRPMSMLTPIFIKSNHVDEKAQHGKSVCRDRRSHLNAALERPESQQIQDEEPAQRENC